MGRKQNLLPDLPFCLVVKEEAGFSSLSIHILFLLSFVFNHGVFPFMFGCVWGKVGRRRYECKVGRSLLFGFP